jgi:DUF1680 family protein
VRLIPSVPGYVYAQKNNDVYVNLFISSNADLTVSSKPVQIVQQNNYPWDGLLKFNIAPKSPLAFNLLIRIPGWAQNQAMPSDLYKFEKPSDKKVEIKVNGQTTEYSMRDGYAVVAKTWKKGDIVEVNLPMEVRRVIANENVKDDIGKVALQRGPIIYCAEWPDNNGKVANIIMPDNATFTTEYKPDLLNGVVIVKSNTPAVVINNEGNMISTVNKEFTAIPYYAWAHRGKGEMMVWFPTKVKDIDLVSR